MVRMHDAAMRVRIPPVRARRRVVGCRFLGTRQASGSCRGPRGWPRAGRGGSIERPQDTQTIDAGGLTGR
jgi:hypothetical protein